ncbi:MAG: SDR family oxidoreductase [Lachnospiraceae bacterium]|jgi:NAD(P)-dependent dehydrogenase (short-subunit alcohol dehydrogenase family)|nr:SDR family oxidoreductase [Lachnospiraceae bacterium]
MSQPQTESYTAAKGGISELTHAVAVSLVGKARVNSISAGWINTTDSVVERVGVIQQPAGCVGSPKDIAEMVKYLCSDKAGFVPAENICIDDGRTKQMICHGECTTKVRNVGGLWECEARNNPDIGF